ncbi:MAG: L-Ala-D/L-Glu epimerase [Gammaproteobacteria bacterium]|nr:L-Ala-D/L-Glu epimerase [Gammaproteobacteria bacterium]
MRTVKASSENWPLRQAFTISRGTKTEAGVIVVEVSENNVTGRGECVPYARYGETIDSVLKQIQVTAPLIEDGVTTEALLNKLDAGAARNAIDCALWDLNAKLNGQRVWEIARIPMPEPAITAYTLSLDTPEAMGIVAKENSYRPLLKLKLDAEQIVERVQAVHESAPGASLIVDANEAWDMKLLEQVVPDLHGLGVKMIEQPLPAGSDEPLRSFKSTIPLAADESCHTAHDFDELPHKYDMINIKLDKTGGLTEALKLRRMAKDANMQWMVGCMIGTSLGMAPATLLTQGASFVDLDGPLLLKHDREPGLNYDNNRVHPPAPSLWG